MTDPSYVSNIYKFQYMMMNFVMLALFKFFYMYALGILFNVVMSAIINNIIVECSCLNVVMF